MKKTNTFILVVMLTLGCFMNYSCTNDVAIDNSANEGRPTHHLGFYSFSNDLLEIYDAEVQAVCEGQVLSTIDLKKTEAYSKNANTTSYNVDTYVTAKSVEYKLKLSCCKAEDDLELARNYELGIDAQFINVTNAPDAALEMLDEEADCNSQSLNGMTLQSYFGVGSEYSGQTVYEVYALMNSRSFVLGSSK